MDQAYSARLAQLTWTRYVAALFVVFFHLGRGVPLISDQYWSPIIMNGPAAVSYFFTLSGFIMASVYHDLELSGARQYWIARFARIYPVYIIGIVWFILTYQWSVTELVLTLGLVQAWFPASAMSLNPVGWSLAVEAFFYALFPALILIARALGWRMWLISVLIVWAASQVVYQSVAAILTKPWPDPQSALLAYFPIVHLNSFLVGMGAGMLTRHVALPRGLGWPLVALGAFGCGATLLHPSYLVAILGPHIHLSGGILSPFFAMIMVGIVNVDVAWMRSKLAIFCGEASYAVYIFHFGLSELFSKYILTLTSGNSERFWAYFIFLMGVSFFAYTFIETPLRKAIRNVSDLWRRTQKPTGKLDGIREAA